MNVGTGLLARSTQVIAGNIHHHRYGTAMHVLTLMLGARRETEL